jgi:hypothetical protein
MSEHKAEIAIGVGVAALAAATIVTGGAALAVAGTGAAVSAGTVATVVAGGVVAGAGLNLAQQGAQIKDGVVDPATGKKKTDIAWGDVAKSGAIGGAAAFGYLCVLLQSPHPPTRFTCLHRPQTNLLPLDRPSRINAG